MRNFKRLRIDFTASLFLQYSEIYIISKYFLLTNP
nr:MAG TPA: hypothetical protein [Caudoviricetes sp.]